MSKEEINAFLGAGTVFEGKLLFQGAVRVDGHFNGEIISEGALIAGKDSVMRGSLTVGELILSGSFEGEVQAKRRVMVHKGGQLTGTVVSPALVVEEGATLDGGMYMRETPPPKVREQAKLEVVPAAPVEAAADQVG